jgi:hypothetical protein
MTLIRTRPSGIRVVRLSGPGKLGRLRGARRRTLAVVTLRAPFAAGSWRRAIQLARENGRLDLAVAPRGRRRSAALAAYLRLLRGPKPPPPPHPPPPPVAAAVFIAATGSDSNPCSAAAPCRTFDRGYRVAKPGDAVEVAAGTYPGQSLGVDPSKTSNVDVVIRPAARARVVLSSPLEISARHIELRDMTLRWRILPGAKGVTLRNIKAHGTIRIHSSGSSFPSEIKVLGGEIGPSVDSDPQIGSNGRSTTASPRNILFEGVDFHDMTISPGSDAHVECLQVWAVDGLTIRNSRFRNCYHFDVFIQKLPGGAASTPRNILLENNFMAQPLSSSGQPAVRFSDTHGESWANLTVRNNSVLGRINLATRAPYANVRILSNIAHRLDGVPGGIAVDHNVWYSGSKIGAHDRVAPHGFRNPSGFDLHLVGGAAAIDSGHASHPGDDIDGQRRPQGRGPDAGADES